MAQKLLRYEDGILAATPSTYAHDLVAVSDGLVLLLRDDDDNALIAKVDFNGVVQWHRVLLEWANYLSTDALGNIYSTGMNGVTKFNSAGVIQWKKATPLALSQFVRSYSSSAGGVATVSNNSTTTRRFARLDAAGDFVEGWTYTAAANEEMYNALHQRQALSVQHSDGDWLSLSVNTAGDDYLMLVKQDSSSVSGRSLKVTGYVMVPIGLCRLTDGTLVAAYYNFGDTDTLYLVNVDATTATVYWSKKFETSLTTYLSSGSSVVNVFAVGDGFAVGFGDDNRSPAIAMFDASGSLQWAVGAENSTVDGGAWGWGPQGVVSANGGIYFLADIAFSAECCGATLVQLSSTGEQVGGFGNITLSDVASTITVSAGPTVVAASETPGSVSTTGGTSSDVTYTDLASSIYPVTYYDDLLQFAQMSGHKAIHHGQFSGNFPQSTPMSGHLATRHGNLMSVVHLPSGTTICAIEGAKATKHGQMTSLSSVTSAMTGHLATKHGTAQCKMTYAMTGTLSIAHGTSTFKSLFKMTGHRATKHGTATTLMARAMTGHLATKHGTMTSSARSEGQVTGHLATKHGTMSFKTIFRITPSFKTRHGTMKSVRSITC